MASASPATTEPAKAPDRQTIQPGVVRRATDDDDRLMHRQVPALAISGGLHLTAAIIFAFLASRAGDQASPVPEDKPIVVRADEKPEEKQALTNEDVGLDPNKKTNYDLNRIEDISVPGIVRPEEPVGIVGADNAARQTVSPPPGVGGGAGGGSESNIPGAASMVGGPGGYIGGRLIPGQMFGGRSGATREKMVAAEGGNPASEAAVAKGLAWLKKQQKPDGKWKMLEGTVDDDFGATGLALLPFLAGGITHKLDPKDKNSVEYSKCVELGLRWLVNKQQGNGLMGTDTTYRHYSHAICVVALCEALGMTNDSTLRGPAQRGVDYLLKAQHSAGGFRYSVGQPGDVSVTGWCLQALQSAKLAGLKVPAEAFYKVGNFLDTMQTQKGAAYGYSSAGGRPNMTAVGLLCRAYLGWGPKNPAMMAGVENLKKNLPRKGLSEIYYYYYATQVMHFCATEEDWHKVWNPQMRDLLIDTQDNGVGPNRGSWTPDRTHTGDGGGRLCATCLSLLTLEVYYRHLPLYKRDTTGLKDLE
ncbi:MAG: terpene cyclase/mutase family protein [Gemmataceae bacterium]|nr:terpene cyclase/mutase family protein [Gemmataceae bacterium]